MGAYNNQFKRAADGWHPTQNGHRSQSSATDYVRGNSLFSRIDILTILSVHYLLGGAKTMLKILVAIILSVPFVISASGEELDKWELADRETVRLSPAAFPDLPQSIKYDLDARGCTIPQLWFGGQPHNVIKGHFKDPNQIDWAVLCSIDRKSALLVYWGGCTESVSEVSSWLSSVSSNDKGWLQGMGGDKVGFGRGISTVDVKYITDHAHWYGGELPPHLDHEGINEAFVEKASVVHYWYEGEWLQLRGAD